MVNLNRWIVRLYWPILDITWASAVICLPFTSFPLMWYLMGVVVAPLSALPVFILILFWLIPHLLRRGALPREAVPLIVFLMVALIVTLAAFFNADLPGFRDRPVFSQMVRSFTTLGIGLGFYFLFASWPVGNEKIRKTLQWLNIGGLISIVWTAWQIYFLLFRPAGFPMWLWDIHDLFVVGTPYSLLKGGSRISGLAYEPSWFAYQLNLMYFPYWLAATFTKFSAFRGRILRLSFENIMLVLGVIEFYYSSPRIGMLAFLMMLIFIFIKWNLSVYRKIMARLNILAMERSKQEELMPRGLRTILGIGYVVLILVIYLGLAAGLVYLGSLRDPRIAIIIESPPTSEEVKAALVLDQPNLLWIASRFAFMERLVYWFTGLNIFSQSPWIGVGLGNVGYHFAQHVPSMGWASFEIRDIFYRLSSFPNTKSLWVRLLAESGLLGFSIFLGWLYTLWRSTRMTAHSHELGLKTLSLSGQLFLIALIAEGFSVDSFAMPYLWVMTGIISAAGMQYRSSVNLRPAPSGIQEKDTS